MMTEIIGILLVAMITGLCGVGVIDLTTGAISSKGVLILLVFETLWILICILIRKENKKIKKP